MIRNPIGKAVLKYEEGDDPEGYDEPVLGIITKFIPKNDYDYYDRYLIRWINDEVESCSQDETELYMKWLKNRKRYADDP
jgi:uncharacterized protein YggL (DUF469 family)